MIDSSKTVYIIIYGTHLGESSSGLAVKFSVRKVGEEVLSSSKIEWFPISQLNKSYIAPLESSNDDWLMVPEWILKQKDLY